MELVVDVFVVDSVFNDKTKKFFPNRKTKPKTKIYYMGIKDA